jgi:sporulation protein YlmC with PRC-barrel domain
MHIDDNQHDDDSPAELQESGMFMLNEASKIRVEVRRGMLILTRDGRKAGTVTAVVLDKKQRKITHILLGRLIQQLEYRVVPLELVAQVSEEVILLHIFNPAVNSLANWRGS